MDLVSHRGSARQGRRNHLVLSAFYESQIAQITGRGQLSHFIPVFEAPSSSRCHFVVSMPAALRSSSTSEIFSTAHTMRSRARLNVGAYAISSPPLRRYT